ncbi:MAG TPA: transglycosylase SLT domain-containing protein [Candidatus Binataceae bacterium]|nr:transglycosylase SLT domain-containing protein [Candidatus Binataceae bacterium]
MQTNWREWASAFLISVALSGCASQSQTATAAQVSASQSSPEAEASPITYASYGAPSTPAGDFVEGYHAYQRHDYPVAIARLRSARDHYAQVRDYSLFFLASAERQTGDLNASADDYVKLVHDYPMSILAPGADAALADMYLKLGRMQDATAAASDAISSTADSGVEQDARLALARATLAQGDSRGAYNELIALREKYPHGAHDAQARELAYSILASTPSLETRGAQYYRDEAALLLKEGESTRALKEVDRGLALSPPIAMRAELVYLKARALHGNNADTEVAYREYLRLAPKGTSAPEALEGIALIQWREDRRDAARATFTRLISNFPGSHLAPTAMLRIGRTYEEDAKLDLARTQYERLIARYRSSDAAQDARFRAPWMDYMTGSFARAAVDFSAAARSGEASQRDMFTYWSARAKEKAGDAASARELYERVAASIESNYYPAMAAARIAMPYPSLPAAAAPDPTADFIPKVSGAPAFHLDRTLTFRELGLADLEAGELRRLAREEGGDRDLSRFVLAGFYSTGAYYDAIVAAGRMEKHGLVTRETAERIRYPRAYWDLISTASRRNGLDAMLVLALARQESLFNPKATSVSNARGLMQLMPETASRVARLEGIDDPTGGLYDPTLNVELGTAYLRGLMAMFNGDEIKSVAAYNGGEHAVQSWSARFAGEDDEWVENIGFRETRDYVKKVMGGKREYTMLYRSASGAQHTAPPSSESTSAKTSSTSPL